MNRGILESNQIRKIFFGYFSLLNLFFFVFLYLLSFLCFSFSSISFLCLSIFFHPFLFFCGHFLTYQMSSTVFRTWKMVGRIIITFFSKPSEFNFQFKVCFSCWPGDSFTNRMRKLFLIKDLENLEYLWERSQTDFPSRTLPAKVSISNAKIWNPETCCDLMQRFNIK